MSLISQEFRPHRNYVQSEFLQIQLRCKGDPMNADACIMYCGIRFDVSPNEIEDLETRSDWRMSAARRAGLKCYWGNFGGLDEHYVLFIGMELGVLGPENQQELRISAPDVEALFSSTRARLKSTGIDGEPVLHVKWQPDV